MALQWHYCYKKRIKKNSLLKFPLASKESTVNTGEAESSSILEIYFVKSDSKKKLL